MLNYIEMSDLWQYKDSLPDGRIKELLNNVLFEYSRYTECGTPEDCKDRLEWMNMSYEDIRKKFNFIVKGFREEVEYIREDANRKAEAKYKPAPKKRGRPKKVKEETGDENVLEST